MNKRLMVDVITNVMLTGSAVCGGLILYCVSAKGKRYSPFSGTLVGTKENGFRIRNENDGTLSPTLPLEAVVRDGERERIWVLTPQYYVEHPTIFPPEVVLRILGFCLASIGKSLLGLAFLRPVVFRPTEDDRACVTHRILVGTIGVLHLVLGLVSALVVSTDGTTTYVPVTGIAEHAQNGRFRVRFEDEPTTHDMDIPVNIKPVFGEPFTVYRVDLAKTRVTDPRGADVFFYLLAILTFSSFLIFVVFVYFSAETTVENAEPDRAPRIQARTHTSSHDTTSTPAQTRPSGGTQRVYEIPVHPMHKHTVELSYVTRHTQQ